MLVNTHWVLFSNSIHSTSYTFTFRMVLLLLKHHTHTHTAKREADTKLKQPFRSVGISMFIHRFIDQSVESALSLYKHAAIFEPHPLQICPEMG